jgi:hypothetical protein
MPPQDDDGSILVELSYNEILTAASVGVRRQVAAMHGNRQSFRQPLQNDALFDFHILGAMAEMVVARSLNLFWSDAVGSINSGDVGGLVEVRCRRVISGLDLGMGRMSREKLDRPYVLVHYNNTRQFRMVGWIPGQQAWDGAVLHAETGIRYFKGSVPPLRPMHSLATELSNRKLAQ